MRKLFIAALAASAVGCAFAQKSNLNTTKDALYPPEDFAKARKAIEVALENPETSGLAETHFLAGQVYFKTYEDEEKKRMTGGTADAGLKYKCVMNAVDEYVVAYELDKKPNEKGKVKIKYQKDIETNIHKLEGYLINEGNNAYQDKKYGAAVDLWGKYIELPNLTPICAGLKKDTLYGDIYFYAINAAMMDETQTNKAIEMMEAFKTSDNKNAQTVNEWLYQTYMTKGDTAKAVATLKDGANRFPKSMYFTGNLINHYIQSGKTDEAVKYLDNAIAKSPKEAQYYVVKGNMLTDMKKYDDAIATFNQILANVDANSADAYAGIGSVHVMKGQELTTEANNIPMKQKAKYEAAVKAAKAEFAAAQDPLEKARKIDPKSKSTLNMLRAVYMQTNQGAKADEVSKALKEL